MNLSNKDIRKIAKLAQIELTESDSDKFLDQVTKTIIWIEQLQEVNTENIEPLSTLHNLTLTMEEDRESQDQTIEEILKNSPNQKYNYFSVPKVIE